MNWSEGTLGRLFVLRLEEGEEFNDTVEAFARERGLTRGLVFLLGGADADSRLVVGPAIPPEEPASSMPASGSPSAGLYPPAPLSASAIVPLLHTLAAPHEVLALGTLFPDADGRPSLHLHAAAGREGDATVGCTRAGTVTWLVAEVVILEILGTTAARRADPATGFELLQAG